MTGYAVAVRAGLLVIVFLAIPVAFFLVLRSKDSDSDPALESAQAMAHRMLRGQESISTESKDGGRYVFRVVFQSTDAAAGSLFPTHIGVAVCMRGDRAVDAVRFSFLHYRPVCQDGHATVVAQETSRAADRARAGGDFTRDADRYDEPTPQRLGSP
ncbi:MAG TPA: hypothetical protein VH834_22055 [Solirubrobacteraceae bacterium]|jgi:hypothetical protein